MIVFSVTFLQSSQYQEAGFDEDVLMAGVEKSRERMKQEMEAERMEEAPWSQQLPL